MCIQSSTCMMQPFLHRTPIQMMQQTGPPPVSSMTPKLMVCVNVLYPYVCAACVHMWLLTVTLLYISFLADWSTEGCEIIMEDAGTVTYACNHLTAFSILQVHTPRTHTFTPRTHTFTHKHTHTHTCTREFVHIYIHTCKLITMCAVWWNLFISTPYLYRVQLIQLFQTRSFSYCITLSVVGGAVFLVLAVTGVAYLIWR